MFVPGGHEGYKGQLLSISAAFTVVAYVVSAERGTQMAKGPPS